MKFIVSRKNISLTENRKPCDEAGTEELTVLDYRTVGSLEEAKSKIWYKDWLAGGVNHREENGLVVCEKKEKAKKWVVELGTLDKLIRFQEKYGDITVTNSSPYVGISKEIIIQDPEKR